MSKLVLVLIVLLGVMMLFTTACGNEDDDADPTNTITSYEDLTPAQAEWAIMFIGGDWKTTYQVGAYWIGGANAPLATDTATLTVNGTDVDIMAYMPGLWMGSCNATQGADAAVKFVYNGTTKIDASFPMVSAITGATFPNNYNPAQTADISWTLPSNNQHQVVGVSAYSDPITKEWTGEYSKEVPVSARSYTFPANPIANAPADAIYSMGISDVNYKIQSKIALLSVTGAWSDEYSKSSRPEEKVILARRLLNTLSK